MKTKVRIDSLAYGGKGVGRVDGKVVFVPYTAPGDLAAVEITAEKKGYSEAVLLSLDEPSELRTTPPCPYFGVCGGCTLQHIKYPEQVALKQKMLDDALRRIGKVAPPAYDPPEPAAHPYAYRSRARFHVKGRRWGFFESGTNRVVEVDACPILTPELNAAYDSVRKSLVGYSGVHGGGLYSVEIGVSPLDRTSAAVFYTSAPTEMPWKRALEGCGLKGFEVRLEPYKRGRGTRVLTEGDLSLAYSIDGLTLNAFAGVFSQVNTEQNLKLVDRVIEYSALGPESTVADLYCGVGNFTLPSARRAGSVTGVESVRDAVEQAASNARMNGVANAEFVVADVSGWLRRWSKGLETEGVDVVILDPPRGGESRAAVSIPDTGARKVVYVSCSPPTLARDLSLLAEKGYRPTRAGLIDMFPQTSHIECVVETERP